MKSPITGKDMTLTRETRSLDFRKESFAVVYHYYLCKDSGEQFTTTDIDELNMRQLYNQYREKHKLPFPDEIKFIREKYNLPASKMSEILGFGINSYRNYEAGEVPNQSNARLIQLATDPKKFKDLVQLTDVLEESYKKKLLKHIDRLIEEEEQNYFSFEFKDYLMGDDVYNEFSGYRKPSLEKLTEMVVFFTNAMEPFKTKMNKLLFYADFLMFKRNCYSISGARYRAIDMGPVPNNFNSIFEYMANRDDIDIWEIEFPNGYTGEQFRPNLNRNFNSEIFSDEELKTLNVVSEKFKNTETSSIIKISHEERIWEENFNKGKKLISYKQSFDLNEI